MRAASRAVALVLLGLWLAPAATALAAAWHVGVHHHGGHRPPADGTAVVLRLAAVAEHGHSHALTAPEHDHPALRAERAAAAAVVVAGLPPATATAPERPGVDATDRLPAPERPPPRALFTLHCSLLR